MFTDSIKVTGQLKIRKYDDSMNLVEERDHKNLVVYTGKKLIASRLFANTRPPITITGASGTGSLVTLTFSAQLSAPYDIGTKITVVGMIPSGYNGIFRVESCTTTSVTFSNTTTATLTTPGIISGLENGTIKYMAIGEGPTSANLSDIALYNQRAIVSLFSSETSFADGDSSLIYVAQFPAGVATTANGTALYEAALVNDDNVMLCRTVFSPVSKAAGESLEIFWKVTIA